MKYLSSLTYNYLTHEVGFRVLLGKESTHRFKASTDITSSSTIQENLYLLDIVDIVASNISKVVKEYINAT